MSKKTNVLVLIVLLMATANIYADTFLGAKPILVGVLDEKQCAKDANTRALIMYAKTKDGWIGLDSPDSPDIQVAWDRQWTVGFDGKSLGTLRLTNSSPAYPRRTDGYFAGEVLLAPAGQFPIVRNTSKSFGGWCGEPKSRPLVLVSEPNVKDPAEWKPFKVGSEYKEMLFDSLNRELQKSKIVNCTNPEQEKATPYVFGVEELKIYKGYRSKDGGVLISVGLNSDNYHCDGPLGPEWSSQWFYIRNSRVEFIGDSLMLLDEGDYDEDGKSEVLFWSSGYNEDGYVLYYDDFRKKVPFKWHYH
ncbi:MAG: hypothetical protein HZB47_06650 [Nitrosomonadales bacterium]|nr:hypothetical protein [Nitrosomonadales bacterium]